MTKSGWISLTLIPFAFLIIPALIISVWANRHFTNFEEVEAFSLMSENLDVRFSKHGCTGQWLKRDVYFTSKSRRFVWDTIYQHWEPRPGTMSLRQEEAIYEESGLRMVKFKSKIAYDSYPHLYSVFVTNEIAFYFPKKICDVSIEIAQLGRR